MPSRSKKNDDVMLPELISTAATGGEVCRFEASGMLDLPSSTVCCGVGRVSIFTGCAAIEFLTASCGDGERPRITVSFMLLHNVGEKVESSLKMHWKRSQKMKSNLKITMLLIHSESRGANGDGVVPRKTRIS